MGNCDFLSVIPLAVHIANKYLGPMIEALVNLKKPPIVLKSDPSLWSRYFDSGPLEMELLDAEKITRFYISMKSPMKTSSPELPSVISQCRSGSKPD
jgi:hypothetical protein